MNFFPEFLGGLCLPFTATLFPPKQPVLFTAFHRGSSFVTFLVEFTVSDTITQAL